MTVLMNSCYTRLRGDAICAFYRGANSSNERICITRIGTLNIRVKRVSTRGLELTYPYLPLDLKIVRTRPTLLEIEEDRNNASPASPPLPPTPASSHPSTARNTTHTLVSTPADVELVRGYLDDVWNARVQDVPRSDYREK